MAGDEDREKRGEREKRSWREIDQLRNGPRGSVDHEPKGPAAKARGAAAARQYIKRIDGLFTDAKGGAEAVELTKAVKDAHGTPKLASACTAYVSALGMPDDPSLLSLFLDAGNPDVVIGALDELRALHEGNGHQLTSGQRTQVRTLALDSNNAVVDAAEQLLEIL